MWSNMDGNRIYSQWECRMVELLGKIIWQFLTKLNFVSPYNSAITLLGIYSTDLKLTSTQRPAHKFLQQLHIQMPNSGRNQDSLSRGMGKETVIRLCKGVVFTTKRNELWSHTKTRLLNRTWYPRWDSGTEKG